MNELLLYVLLFVSVYIIDLATALLHRKIRPHNFKRVEANNRFRKCLEQRGIIKGIGVYLILSITESIILLISVLFATSIIFSSSLSTGLAFLFLWLSIVHVLGTLTNLIALFKKDRVPLPKKLNMNLNKPEAQNEQRII